MVDPEQLEDAQLSSPRGYQLHLLEASLLGEWEFVEDQPEISIKERKRLSNQVFFI